MALWAYTLVVCWYAQWARRRRRLPFRQPPWYRTKKSPSFADMLVIFRCQSWMFWVSDHPDLGHALLVCATETKTDADIGRYVDAMRDIFSASLAQSA